MADNRSGPCGLEKPRSSEAPDALNGSEHFQRFKGAFAENFVMTELQAMGFHPYFWRSGNTAEVDFLVETAGEIVPIEVKAAENTKAKSLQLYVSRYHPRRAIKTSLRNVGITRQEHLTLCSVPLYMLWKLRAYLEMA